MRAKIEKLFIKIANVFTVRSIKQKTLKVLFSVFLLSFALESCRTKEDKQETVESPVAAIQKYAPKFTGLEAYHLVQKQVNFGPRVPGTKAHKACGDWIVSSLKSFGIEVMEQKFSASSYIGSPFEGRNIIGIYKPSAAKRILLAAHWDTREMADKDTERKNQPIPGANDGASGVAVLLEIARLIQQDSIKPDVGIDFIFFDAEDGGAPEDFAGNPQNDYGGYCLGSEYWSKNPHNENYTAYYGILLDMVGAKGAKFLQEQTSMQVAPSIVDRVWKTAASLGFKGLFVNALGSAVTDDHWPIIQNRKIPTIDIIDLQGGSSKVFFDAHHTHADDMDLIDGNVLNAVGTTVLQVLYNE